MFDYIHPEDRPRVQEAFQRLLLTPGEMATMEFRFLHKESAWRFMEVTGRNLTHLPEVAGVVVNCRDVTDRVLAERALRDSEERFRKLFEAGPVGVVIGGPEGQILGVNGAFCRMLGYGEAELLGRRTSDLTHPDDRDSTIAVVRAIATEEVPTCRSEKRYLAKSGGTVWADVAVSLVRGDLGQPLYGVAVVRDITEQKRAEEQLRASQERLRAYAAYVVAAREEERARVAREIHDELGQMVTALKMDLEGLSAEFGIRRPSRAAIQRRIARMFKHLRSSTDWARRISAELRPGVLDHFGLAAAIEWQAREFELATGIKCAIREMAADLTLSSDRSTGVFRVFQEVLTNAARHSNATRISVRLTVDREWITLVVKDNGAGIREASLRDPRSLGVLGMQERAKLLDGTLRFESVRSKGTTVTLRIPIGQAASL